MKKQNYLFFLLFCLLFIVFEVANAAKDASVITVKGQVTKLVPGARVASTVKVGDFLPEDTSVLTHEKSMIRIKLNDGTTVTLGANSKVIITKNDVPSKPKVMSLLTGRLRASIIKDKANGDKTKFFVKTRNAAMGVRGTEFETIYNPEINSTSTVTLSGKVLMAKIDEKKIVQAEKISEKSKVEEAQKIDKVLEKSFKDENTVQVSKGKFSGVVENLDNATIPVKIAPTQFKALVSDSDTAKKEGNKITDVKVEESDLLAEEEAPPEGMVDHVKGKVAPKAGGYLDLKTGLYVPPPQGSKLDPIAKVYVPPKEAGSVSDKGEYVPPKGMELDVKKGFIIAKNDKISEEEKEKLTDIQESLNGNILQKSIDNNELIAMSSDGVKFNRLDLSYALGAGGSQAESKDHAINSRHKKRSGLQHLLKIGWRKLWNPKFDFRLNLGVSKIVYPQIKNENYAQPDKTFYSGGFGVGYHYSENFTLKLSLYRDGQPYMYDTAGTILKTYNVTQLRPGLEYSWYKGQEFESGIDLELKMNMKGLGSDKINSGGGAILKIYGNLNVGDGDFLGTFIQTEVSSIETNSYNVENYFVGIGFQYITEY